MLLINKMTTSQREINLKKLAETEFDILIIGVGINGAVSAASLSKRGLKVALIDARELCWIYQSAIV